MTACERKHWPPLQGLKKIRLAQAPYSQLRSGLSAAGSIKSDSSRGGQVSHIQVADVPGRVFGPSGDGHVRCSYAPALPLLE